MKYQPREGIDYLVDLYKLVDVPPDVEADKLKQALNIRVREYHPDRLQGLAPEFMQKGELTTRLLNRARAILLDPEKRGQYDEILESWEGPISSDGTPVIHTDDALRAEMALLPADEIEALFAKQRKRATAMLRHDPEQQAMLGRLLEAAEGKDAKGLREAYDVALLAQDQALAIEETERGILVGLREDKHHAASLGYAEKIQRAIEGARATQTEEYRRRALGGVSIRLALLAEESSPNGEEDTETAPVPTGALPHYFEAQAKRIIELAAQREALLAKRLEIFEPTYPLAEMQTEAQPNFAIGITQDTHDEVREWIGFNFDPRTATLTNTDLPPEIEALLRQSRYEQVYHHGYNILTFPMKDHIAVATLLNEAYNKHLQAYFPEAMRAATDKQG